ncbi:MAG: DUF2621 family protein [Candidatus Omnitrophica bacterium]|nr:DUF2621 family protein [Candidatus Omnitrophota bacterium]
MNIEWRPDAEQVFQQVVSHLPQFHRSIAERLVREKAPELARSRQAERVTREDVIGAFMQEVPPAFKEMLERLLHKLRIPWDGSQNDRAQTADQDTD